jgi:hypothetical protein
VHELCDELGLRCQVDITTGAARAWTNVDDRKHLSILQIRGRFRFLRLSSKSNVVL